MPVSLSLGLVFGLSLLVGYHWHGLRKRQALLRAGLHSTRQLMTLLQALQQHRGMHSAVLGGDTSFHPRLEAKRRGVDELFATLSAPSPHSAVQLRRRGERLRADWVALRESCERIDAKTSFQRHSALIRLGLEYLRDLAARTLPVGALHLPPPLFLGLWQRLPEAAEVLGQLRALGTGITASGRLSEGERIRLGFLSARLDQMATHLGTVDERELDTLIDARSRILANRVAALCRGARAPVDDFLRLFEAELLQRARPRLTAASYFAAATQAIEALYRVYYLALDTIEETLGGTHPA